MHDDRSHPLLAQIPLTVSPFISLPTATTLPYTYKTLPSTLPPSSTGSTAAPGDEKPKYIVSPSGHTAHPDDIISSCGQLQDYIKKVQDDADRELKHWEEKIAARELAEKRRVAPGWLDSDARILEPERVNKSPPSQSNPPAAQPNIMDLDTANTTGGEQRSGPSAGDSKSQAEDAGDELDRAFGGLGVR